MSGHISCLCGTPRSGKSTYALMWEGIAEQFSTSDGFDGIDRLRVVVNSDQIRLALHGKRYSSEHEPEVHKITRVMVKALFNQGYHILIDETNCSQGSIRQWLEIDPAAEFIVLNTKKSICIQRAHDTGQSDLVPVIAKAFENMRLLCELGCGELYYADEKVLKEDVLAGIEVIRKEVNESSK